MAKVRQRPPPWGNPVVVARRGERLTGQDKNGKAIR